MSVVPGPPRVVGILGLGVVAIDVAEVIPVEVEDGDPRPVGVGRRREGPASCRGRRSAAADIDGGPVGGGPAGHVGAEVLLACSPCRRAPWPRCRRAGRAPGGPCRSVGGDEPAVGQGDQVPRQRTLRHADPVHQSPRSVEDEELGRGEIERAPVWCNREPRQVAGHVVQQDQLLLRTGRGTQDGHRHHPEPGRPGHDRDSPTHVLASIRSRIDARARGDTLNDAPRDCDRDVLRACHVSTEYPFRAMTRERGRRPPFLIPLRRVPDIFGTRCHPNPMIFQGGSQGGVFPSQRPSGPIRSLRRVKERAAWSSLEIIGTAAISVPRFGREGPKRVARPSMGRMPGCFQHSRGARLPRVWAPRASCGLTASRSVRWRTPRLIRLR